MLSASTELARTIQESLGFGPETTVEISPAAWGRGYDFALRLPAAPIKLPVLPDSVSALYGEGQYLNVRLAFPAAWKVLLQIVKRQSASAFAGRRIAVEHTSLTPAYPLNLSTFRSTAIGEAIARSVKRCGGSVSVRYFLEDRCWHSEVIAEAHQQWGELKADHAVGRAFAVAVLTRRGLSRPEAEEIAKNLFSYTDSNDEPIDADPVEACLRGVLQSIQRAGGEEPIIDRESHIVTQERSAAVMSLIETRIPPTGILSPSIRSDNRPSYVTRSAAYFWWLLREFDLALPVVSNRQRSHIDSAAFWALEAIGATTRRVVPIYFADVLVDQKSDSLSEARFTCFDSTLDALSAEYRVPVGLAADLLKLIILAHPLSRPVRLGSGVGVYVKSTLGKALINLIVGESQMLGSRILASDPHQAQSGDLFVLADAIQISAGAADLLDPTPAAALLIALMQRVATGGRGLHIQVLLVDAAENLAESLGLSHLAVRLGRAQWK